MAVVWMATLLLSRLIQAVWYCFLPFFFLTIRVETIVNWNPPTQPAMAPDLVSPEHSFNVLGPYQADGEMEAVCCFLR